MEYTQIRGPLYAQRRKVGLIIFYVFAIINCSCVGLYVCMHFTCKAEINVFKAIFTRLLVPCRLLRFIRYHAPTK